MIVPWATEMGWIKYREHVGFGTLIVTPYGDTCNLKGQLIKTRSWKLESELGLPDGHFVVFNAVLTPIREFWTKNPISEI